MNPQPIQGTALCANPAEAVARFLHEGCADDAGRTMSIATFTLSLWQITYGPITATVPSALLVHATDVAGGDPLDAFAAEFVFHDVRKLEQRLKQEEETGIKRTLACPGEPGPSMRTALHCAELARSRGITSHFEGACESFNNYRSNYYGSGPAYRYGRAWSDEYGWLSGEDNRMVLRLEHPDDRKTLRKDLLGASPKLRDPRGLDHLLQMVPKQLALSGSLPGSVWDRPLVDALMRDGGPVLFLPHSTTAPLKLPYSPDLHLACMQVADTGWRRQVTAEQVLPDDPWVQHYHLALMKRLVHTPMDYAFNVQRILRQLWQVCVRFARAICEQGGGPDAITLISQDLFRSTLRAVVIGVASLTYHGWGFHAGVPRASVVQLLDHLRANGPQTRRDLQRKFPLWLRAGKRDALLDRLSDAGLVFCPDTVVSAVPLSDFISWLHRRPEFPVEGCLSSLMLGKKCRQAGPLPGPLEKLKRRRKPRAAGKAAEETAAEEPKVGEATPTAAAVLSNA
jgi:hypothetical protein